MSRASRLPLFGIARPRAWWRARASPVRVARGLGRTVRPPNSAANTDNEKNDENDKNNSNGPLAPRRAGWPLPAGSPESSGRFRVAGCGSVKAKGGVVRPPNSPTNDNNENSDDNDNNNNEKWPSSGWVGQDEGRGGRPVQSKGGKRRCGARERRARGAPAPPRPSLSPVSSSSARSISGPCCGLSRGGGAGGCFMAVPTASVGGSR